MSCLENKIKRGSESKAAATGNVLTVGRSQIFPWSGVAKITSTFPFPSCDIRVGFARYNTDDTFAPFDVVTQKLKVNSYSS